MTPVERDRFLALAREWRKRAEIIEPLSHGGAMILRNCATDLENLVREMEAKP